jgi:uncharacterized protein (TIGR03492 family)
MRVKRNRILLISNGHGEDQISAVLGGQLAETVPEMEIIALPIVGAGQAYTDKGISILMEGEDLPSGGFSRNSFRNLMMDIRGGLLGLTGRQIRNLKKVRESIDLAVCVGDVYLIILAGFFLRKPLFFLPTAKSDYISPHWKIEIGLMRRFCQKIFPRDAITGKSLASHGLPAIFAGNLMMDCLYYKDPEYFSMQDGWVISLLPGSRFEAYENMKDLSESLVAFENLVRNKGINKSRRYLVALAGGLDFSEIREKLGPSGWTSRKITAEEATNGIVGHLCSPDQEQSFCITVVKGRFADILAASDLVIGLAGTGNEQAVGLGKPVVTFPGRGPQFSEKFVKIQKRLLGDSISLVEREPSVTAGEILRILTDASIKEKMGAIGRERMGEPGGARRIALQIKEYFDQRG